MVPDWIKEELKQRAHQLRLGAQKKRQRAEYADLGGDWFSENHNADELDRRADRIEEWLDEQ